MCLHKLANDGTFRASRPRFARWGTGGDSTKLEYGADHLALEHDLQHV